MYIQAFRLQDQRVKQLPKILYYHLYPEVEKNNRRLDKILERVFSNAIFKEVIEKYYIHHLEEYKSNGIIKDYRVRRLILDNSNLNVQIDCAYLIEYTLKSPFLGFEVTVGEIILGEVKYANWVATDRRIRQNTYSDKNGREAERHLKEQIIRDLLFTLYLYKTGRITVPLTRIIVIGSVLSCRAYDNILFKAHILDYMVLDERITYYTLTYHASSGMILKQYVNSTRLTVEFYKKLKDLVKKYPRFKSYRKLKEYIRFIRNLILNSERN